jgi:predicted nucleotidyltransferase
MNAETELRLASARRLGEVWAAQPGVIAVMLFGSVAEGDCDSASDVDMGVYWSEPPSREVLELVKSQYGSGERFFYFGEPEEGGCVESYRIGGIRHDFAHSTIELWQAHTDDVLDKLNLDSPWQKGLHGTLHGIVLSGAEVIEPLRARLTPYPEPLRLAMLKKHCSFRPLNVLESYARARGDYLFYYELLTKLISDLLFTLCAVNGVYHAMEFKRLERFVAREFSHAPDQLAARLNAQLCGNPVEGRADLPLLVEETLDIVAAQCPQFDIAPVREKWRLVH